MFFELDKTFNSEVKFGNDTIVPVKDKGKILIQLKDRSWDFIYNFLYVPCLHQNLLRMGQLSKKGYDM